MKFTVTCLKKQHGSELDLFLVNNFLVHILWKKWLFFLEGSLTWQQCMKILLTSPIECESVKKLSH